MKKTKLLIILGVLAGCSSTTKTEPQFISAPPLTTLVTELQEGKVVSIGATASTHKTAAEAMALPERLSQLMANDQVAKLEHNKTWWETEAARIDGNKVLWVYVNNTTPLPLSGLIFEQKDSTCDAATKARYYRMAVNGIIPAGQKALVFSAVPEVIDVSYPDEELCGKIVGAWSGIGSIVTCSSSPYYELLTEKSLRPEAHTLECKNN